LITTGLTGAPAGQSRQGDGRVERFALCTALSQWYRGGVPATAEQVATLYIEVALDLVGCTTRR
jgi:hypothetical protein